VDVTDVSIDDTGYVVLKGRFKAIETNTYGIFIIFINDDLRIVENMMAIASHYSSLYDIDPHLPWYIIEEDIVNLKWKGDIAVNISIDLQNYLESSLEGDRGNELYTLLNNNDWTKIESLLQAILIKPLSDRNILLEIVSETVSDSGMRSARAERDKAAKTKPEETAAPPKEKSEKLIDVDLVLAPVSGIPIYELALGDRIMVKISDRTTRGRYYIDLFGAKVDGNVIPVPAEVTKITRSQDGEYSILCRLGENAVGRAVETEQVKLKRYDELDMETPLKEITLDEAPEGKGRFPLFIIVTGGLMFVLLIVFLFMWFYNVL
jgi:hypothetical protein